jgi:hypothetical protein
MNIYALGGIRTRDPRDKKGGRPKLQTRPSGSAFLYIMCNKNILVIRKFHLKGQFAAQARELVFLAIFFLQN